MAGRGADIIRSVRSIRRAIDLCVELDRELWQIPGPLALGEPPHLEGSDLGGAARKVVERARVDHAIADLIVDCIKSRYGTSHPRGPGTIEKRVLLQRPTTIAAAVLPDVRFQDIQYAARRNVRGHFARSSPQSLIVPFHAMARPLNRFLDSRGKRRALRTTTETFFELLRNGLTDLDVPDSEIGRYARLFTECSRGVGYVFPGYSGAEIIVDTSEFDVEFLLTHLFGCPTAIPGFDELFGGGGLILAERCSWDRKPSEGRAILIKGRFGSGKSMLALQLCAEVARKGGVARFVAMEQTAAECRYMLDSIGAVAGLSEVQVVTDGATFGRMLAKGRRDAYSPGILAVLDGINDSTEEFLRSLELDAQVDRESALSLIAVDPINAVHRSQSSTANQTLRTQFVNSIQKVKAQGTNVLFVAEEDTEHPAPALFEENIVDTVIRLSEARLHSYSRRSFEIQKSRLQRECRGLHWYSIRSGEGIHIYPSSAAVYNRIRRRRIPLPGTVGGRNAFGVPELDNVLGADAFYRGDVIAFSGSTGSLKTQLGMSFLLNGDFRLGRDKVDEYAHKSLLVAAREPAESLYFQLTASWAANYLKRMKELQRCEEEQTKDKTTGDRRALVRRLKTAGDIKLCALPLSYIHPGLVLQEIEAAFDDALKRGERIDRVMVTNIAHWALSCPFIREDETFADTLVNLMRRRGATSLFVCGDAIKVGDIQQPILDHADVVVEFEKAEFQGERRIAFRATKTRTMSHRRQRFEVLLEDDELAIRPTGSLLRGSELGRAESIAVRMFLHAESKSQREYNQRWASSLRSTVSREVTVEQQTALYADGGFVPRDASGIDELQVCQIDEYQAPRVGNAPGLVEAVALVPESAVIAGRGEQQPFLEELCGGLLARHEGGQSHWLALPYYADVGILAYRQDLCPAIGGIGSWEELCEAKERWERENASDPKNESVFFDFPRSTDENLNCMFLEILAGISAFPFNVASQRSAAAKQLLLMEFVRELRSEWGKKAFQLFWRLGHRPDVQSQVGMAREATSQEVVDADQGRGLPIQSLATVCDRALVWRHWYGTLNEMAEAMPMEWRRNLAVRPVPNGRGTGGEWLLCIPGHSTALDVGYEILRQATSPESELARMRSGVGLPVRKEFYSLNLTAAVAAASEPLDRPAVCSSGRLEGSAMFGSLLIDNSIVRSALQSAIKRSSIPGYVTWSASLASTLRAVLMLSRTDQLWDTTVERLTDALCKCIVYGTRLDSGGAH